MDLYYSTKEIHHEAEQHPFGSRMAAGEITRQEWCDWLGANLQIHFKLDIYLPPYLQRSSEFAMDLYQLLPLVPKHSFSASLLADKLDSKNPSTIGGLAYVMCGANLRGGQVMAKKLEPLGFPCCHTRFPDMPQANEWLNRLRERGELATSAQQAFRGIISVMDEINEH